MKKVVFITGVAGQDGSYMADLCLQLGYKVHGLARNSQSPNFRNLKHLTEDATGLGDQFHLHLGDVLELEYLINLLKKIKPDLIFNFAAQSHVQVSFEMPNQTLLVNTFGFLNLLNAASISCPESIIYQASTSELIGNITYWENNGKSFSPESPYAVSKLASHNLSLIYSKTHHLRIKDGILFNHESFRRSDRFVTKKIINEAAFISKQLRNKNKDSIPKLHLGNLSAKRDWGWAPEYMLGVLQHTVLNNETTLLLGTGISTSVLEFAQRAFGNFGLEAEDWINVDNNLLRPNDVSKLEANSSDVHNSLGWNPTINWQVLCDLICEEVVRGKEIEVDWAEMISDRNLVFE